MVLGPTSRALGRLLKEEEEEEDDEIAVLPISIADSYGPLYLCWDTLWMKDHSRNTVSYSKGLRIQAFESLEAFRMYYAIGASVSSLHRESTDSPISLCVGAIIKMNLCSVLN